MMKWKIFVLLAVAFTIMLSGSLVIAEEGETILESCLCELNEAKNKVKLVPWTGDKWDLEAAQWFKCENLKGMSDEEHMELNKKGQMALNPLIPQEHLHRFLKKRFFAILIHEKGEKVIKKMHFSNNPRAGGGRFGGESFLSTMGGYNGGPLTVTAVDKFPNCPCGSD